MERRPDMRRDPDTTSMQWKAYYSRPEIAERLRQRKRDKYTADIVAARERQRKKEAKRYANPEKRLKIVAGVKKYRLENRDRIVLKRREKRASLRAEVVGALGGRCVECGESRIEFLAVDHIHGDGAVHRKAVGKDCVYQDIKRLGFPTDRFRVLCHNHNEGELAPLETVSKELAYYRRVRARLLAGLGGKCECCGETDPRFLCLDHVEGRGIDHYRSRGPIGVYLDAIRSGFPRDRFRALCFNCNKARSSYGTCPHAARRHA